MTVGGGVRSVEDVRRLLNAGADKTSFNSAAIASSDTINACSEQVRRAAVHRGGHRRQAPQRPGRAAHRPAARPWGRAGMCTAMAGAKTLGAGWCAGPKKWPGAVGEILLTSMDKDGTKSGFDLKLTRAVADAVAIARDRLGRCRQSRPSGRWRDHWRRRCRAATSIFHYGECHRAAGPRNACASAAFPCVSKVVVLRAACAGSSGFPYVLWLMLAAGLRWQLYKQRSCNELARSKSNGMRRVWCP